MIIAAVKVGNDTGWLSVEMEFIYEETTHGNFTHCPGRSRYFCDWKIGNARKGKGAERGLISVFQS